MGWLEHWVRAFSKSRRGKESKLKLYQNKSNRSQQHDKRMKNNNNNNNDNNNNDDDDDDDITL